jgi:signal transduction histidine kinase
MGAFTGRDPAEEVGDGWLAPVHPDDRAACAAAIPAAVRERAAWSLGYRLRRADGTWARVLDRGAPLDGAGAVDVCLDVSAARSRIDALTRELEDLSHAVSHDLRGPLLSIDGFAELLADEAPELGEEAARRLARIRAGAAEMRAMIDGLARLARVARAEPAPEPVDVSALAGEAVARLREAEPGREVEVRVQQGIEVVGDPGLVRLVVDELLANAWTFTRAGERPVIEVRAAAAADGAQVVSVADDGLGFAPERAEAIFAPFAALHPGEGSSGAGTGLAACRRAVALHGGRIWAEGAPGSGATVSFTLGRGG